MTEFLKLAQNLQKIGKELDFAVNIAEGQTTNLLEEIMGGCVKRRHRKRVANFCREIIAAHQVIFKNSNDLCTGFNDLVKQVPIDVNGEPAKIGGSIKYFISEDGGDYKEVTEEEAKAAGIIWINKEGVVMENNKPLSQPVNNIGKVDGNAHD